MSSLFLEIFLFLIVNKIFLIYFLLLFFSLSFGQIKISTNFESGNAQIININNKENKIIFTPQLKSNQTTPCWFYFKIWGFSHNKPLKIIEINQRKELIPTYAVYSFDNKHWNKVKVYRHTENMASFNIPVLEYDTIYFATSYPYTYSKLLDYISQIASNPFVDTTTLTYSEKGNRVPLIIITDTTQNRNKNLIWIIARQHAFETPSNYCTEGIINFFLRNDSLAQSFRYSSIVYIVPMMDVDNVINGASGRMQKPKDFNRDWTTNSHWQAIKEIKELIQATSEIYEFRIFLDIHATFPGNDQPVFAYFNIYNKYTNYYENLHNFWLIFSTLSSIIPIEITDQTIENYADMYIAKTYPYIDFATTIECDWNQTVNGLEWTPKLWKLTGNNIARAMAIYLSGPNEKK